MIPKDYTVFLESLKNSAPEALWPEALRAVWFDAKGDWEAAHNIAQEMDSPLGSWIHAYLHRKEGDDWNAGYWYRRAGKKFPETGLDKEFKALVETALK
ncbi:MAG: hypothetical protein KJN76_12025 [Eudoraea sp.]|nr:hypothetical protein [Eudoraea sp.]